MKKKEKYDEREWQDIASYLSGEDISAGKATQSFLNEDGGTIEKYFKMIDRNRGLEKVNVDKAWDKLFTRLDEDGLLQKKRFLSRPLLRVAAVLALLVVTTFTVRYIISDQSAGEIMAVATSINEKNRLVNMPDGSTVTLNRSSQLTFPDSFDENIRKVELKGEAFFDIRHDASRPFIVEAGNARVKVLGTSFNIITDSNNNSIEVYVKTGRVLLSTPDGLNEVTIEPGYIGKIENNIPYLVRNINPNYLSWNTEVLTYNGTDLEQVIEDIKRVHNIRVEVSDTSILEHRITTEFNNNSPETIIQLICNSFSLTFEKKGETYYLSR